MNYKFTYTNRKTGNVAHGSFSNVAYGRNVRKLIQYFILREKRNSKFRKLFKDYQGILYDLERVREYLPDRYKPYAHSFDLIKRKLVSIKQIESNYRIEIEIGPRCWGCLYNECGQRAHMMVPHGCLL
jgi:hypothetical protein